MKARKLRARACADAQGKTRRDELPLPPVMDFVVAGVAKAHQVWLIVRAAEFGRDFMVNQISRDIAPASKAGLAERMPGNIQVTDLLPAVTVNLGMIGTADCGIIFSSGDSFMFLAEASFADHFGTAGISAGSEWFIRHENTPFSGTGMNGKQGRNGSSTIFFITILLYILCFALRNNFRKSLCAVPTLINTGLLPFLMAFRTMQKRSRKAQKNKHFLSEISVFQRSFNPLKIALRVIGSSASVTSPRCEFATSFRKFGKDTFPRLFALQYSTNAL